MRLSGTALRVVVPYAVVASLWIVLSDRLIAGESVAAQTTKGLSFVLVSGVAAYFLVAAHTRRTERIRQQVADAEESYRAVFDASPSPTYVVDRSTGRIVAISDAAVEWYGKDRQEMIGMAASQLHPAAERRAFEAWLASPPDDTHGRPWRQGAASGLAPVTMHGADISFAGKPARMVIVTDQTARVDAERRLRTFQQVGQAMPLGLLVLRSEPGEGGWVVHTANPAARQLMRHEGDLVGARLEELAIGGALDAARVQRLVSEGTDESLEEMLTFDDERRILGLQAFGFGAGLGVVITDVTDLRGMEEARLRLLDRLLGSADNERRRLARDLHDGPVQQLSALTIRLGMARLARAGEESSDLEDLEADLQRSIQSLRLLLFDLHPPELEAGLMEATHAFAAGLRQLGAPPVQVHAELDVEIDGPVAEAAFRIAREAITNAVRHSGAGEIKVKMLTGPRSLTVEVSDDGNGMGGNGKGAAGHMGLRGMRDCAELLGGSLEITSSASGTQVEAELPLGRGLAVADAAR